MILVRHALGEVLRRHRTAQGRTLRDVADAARVSLGYLSEIERGQKEPSSELLSAVSDALGVPLSAVLAETGEGVRAKESTAAALEAAARSRPQRVVLNRPSGVPNGAGRAPFDLPRRSVSVDRAVDRRTPSAADPVPQPVVDLVTLPVRIPEPRPGAEHLLLTSLEGRLSAIMPAGVDVDDVATVGPRELAHAAA